MFALPRNTWLAVLVAAAFLASPAISQATPLNSGGISLPGPTTSPKMTKILPLARRELRRNVWERRGNNIPRYRKGRGRIVPYSIADQWCAAFATWIWNRSGYKDYLGTKILWPAYDGTMVAVQVRDLTEWATENGYFSYRARPGYLVAYGSTHIGIVTSIDRASGRAVTSIEGNLRNRISRVVIPMDRVTGYISPVRLTQPQLEKSAVNADMEVPPEVIEEIVDP